MAEIEIKLPADDKYKPLAAAIGLALYNWAQGIEAPALPVTANVAVEVKPEPLTTADIVKTITEEKTTQASDNVVKLSSVAEASASTSNHNVQTQAQEQSSATGTVDADGANAVAGVSQPAGNDLANVDEKGVGKNAAFCGNAAIPFNATGKKKGQWKKRQGVDEEVYLAWYAESLAAVEAGGSTDEGGPKDEINTDAAFSASGQQGGEPQVNTAGAFAQQQTQQVNGQVVNNGQSQQKEVAGALTFPDAGAYMKWQAEQQAAGNITAGDIDSGYAQTQVGIQDLFNPQSAANAVALMYAYLAPIAEGQ